MRNKDLKSVNETILSFVKDLPYFEISNLKVLKIKPNYLRIALSRLLKRGEIIRLKKGSYVSRDFVTKVQRENNSSVLFFYFYWILTRK